jgi:hypothetical protein
VPPVAAFGVSPARFRFIPDNARFVVADLDV